MVSAHQNPFATRHLQALHFRLPDDLVWDALNQRLIDHNFRGAIVGKNGRGKTTLLAELEPHLTARGMKVARTRLTMGDRWWHWYFLVELYRVFRHRRVWLLDSAGLLPSWFFIGLVYASHILPGFIVTVHQDTMLPTLVECQTSPELLLELVGQLDASYLAIYAEHLPALYSRYDGNIRDCLLALYDLVSKDSQGNPALLVKSG